MKLSIRRPSSWALAGLPAGLLGHCWAVQCRAVQIGPLGGARLGSRKVGRKKSKGRANQPLLFPLIRPIPQSRRPPHIPFPAHPGGLSHLVLCMGRQPSQLPPKCWKAGQTTDDAIRHRLDSTTEARRREPGSASCHLPGPKSLPRLLRHLALSLICDLLIWPSRCLALFLGHAFARRRSLGFSLVFLASNSQIQPLRTMRASLSLTSSQLADVPYGRF